MTWPPQNRSCTTTVVVVHLDRSLKLAERDDPTVFLKVSGIGCVFRRCAPDLIRQDLQRAVSIFGPACCLFGSNCQPNILIQQPSRVPTKLPEQDLRRLWICLSESGKGQLLQRGRGWGFPAGSGPMGPFLPAVIPTRFLRRPSLVITGALLALLLPPGLARADGAAPPAPIVVRTVAPSTTPEPRLEEALRLALFPVRVDDGQGHGPDPGSAEWLQAQRTLIGRQCAQAGALRYAWSRVDLNGDGTPEVVATVVGPFVCGTGGCPLLILQERQGALAPITTMSLFKEPLIVSERRSNGWKNLITRVRLDAARSTYAVLAFDGRSYPTNPSVPPARPLQGKEPGTAYLSWDPSGKAQHPLPCEAGKTKP